MTEIPITNWEILTLIRKHAGQLVTEKNALKIKQLATRIAELVERLP